MNRKFAGANDTVCSICGYTFSDWWHGENPGPGMEGENIMQVLCSGCDRILKSGKRCEMCDRW